MHTKNQDVIGEKCIRSDDVKLSLDEASKKLAWKQHYECLLNIEFPQSQNLPHHVDPVVGPAQFIIPDDALKSLRRIKNGKAAGPSGVVAEMLKAAPDICSKIIDLMNAIIREGKVPADCSDSIIVSLFKGKGDALDRDNYRGLKLTDHVLKVIERVVENIIRQTVNIDEMQFRCNFYSQTAPREVSHKTQETVYGISQFGKGL